MSKHVKKVTCERDAALDIRVLQHATFRSDRVPQPRHTRVQNWQPRPHECHLSAVFVEFFYYFEKTKKF